MATKVIVICDNCGVHGDATPQKQEGWLQLMVREYYKSVVTEGRAIDVCFQCRDQFPGLVKLAPKVL